MKKIKIIIEKTKDHYSAYAANVAGIYGGGETADEAKQSVLDAIQLLKEHNIPKNVPDILKGKYQLIYHFDTISLLNYYKKIFTNAALERMTGINQKQIQHYSSGLKKPRRSQVKKIQEAFHELGNELIAVEL